MAMTEKLLPCPFCNGDAWIGTVETPDGNAEWKVSGYRVWCKGCETSMREAPTEAEAITAWNRRTPSIPSDGEVEAAEGKTWFELREPGCVPQLKGPVLPKMVAGFLRELFQHRPTAYVTVITMGASGPLLQDGPECLQMLDGRSMATGSKHIASSSSAHAALTAAAKVRANSEGEYLTRDQVELLRFIDDEEEGQMPGSKSDYRRLISLRLLYEWEDGDYQMHVRLTPAGRMALSAQEVK